MLWIYSKILNIPFNVSPGKLTEFNDISLEISRTVPPLIFENLPLQQHRMAGQPGQLVTCPRTDGVHVIPSELVETVPS